MLNAGSSGAVSWNLIRLLCDAGDEECDKFL